MQKNTNEIPPVVQENIDMLLAQKKLYERATGKYISPVPRLLLSSQGLTSVITTNQA